MPEGEIIGFLGLEAGFAVASPILSFGRWSEPVLGFTFGFAMHVRLGTL
jgi:hypothetical protein